jgi:hypothetical protein
MGYFKYIAKFIAFARYKYTRQFSFRGKNRLNMSVIRTFIKFYGLKFSASVLYQTKTNNCEMSFGV